MSVFFVVMLTLFICTFFLLLPFAFVVIIGLLATGTEVEVDEGIFISALSTVLLTAWAITFAVIAHGEYKRLEAKPPAVSVEAGEKITASIKLL